MTKIKFKSDKIAVPVSLVPHLYTVDIYSTTFYYHSVQFFTVTWQSLPDFSLSPALSPHYFMSRSNK